MNANDPQIAPIPAEGITQKSLFLRGLHQRLEIDQYFRDAAHWNDSVRKPHEAPIDPDPVGEMAHLAEALDRYLAQARWAVVVQGPDDLIAAYNYRDAVARAGGMNAYFEKHFAPVTENDPHLKAVVEPWPYSAEDHADTLVRQAANVREFSPSAPSAKSADHPSSASADAQP
jgi:hypothetical protein